MESGLDVQPSRDETSSKRLVLSYGPAGQLTPRGAERKRLLEIADKRWREKLAAFT